MTHQTSLVSFVEQALSACGALIETKNEQLECLLPDELANELAVPSEFSVDLFGTSQLTLNHDLPFVEQLIDVIQREGRIAQIELKDISTRTSGLRGIIEQTVKLRQSIGEIERINASQGNYLLMHFRISAVCSNWEDSCIFAIGCNEETLTLCPWLTPDITSRSHRQIAPKPWRIPFAQIYAHLILNVRQRVDHLLAPFLQVINRQITRYKKRVERFHRHERKIIIQQFQEDPQGEVDALLAQLADAEATYTEQLSEIPSRYPINIRIEPIAALRLSMPVTRIEYTLRRRKSERSIVWIWNPLTEQLEALPCEKCRRERFDIVPDDDLLQLQCPICS
jgi:hypothetical protein